MAEQIPLARPDLSGREEELVLEVLRSGQLSLGPKLGEFEGAFADWLGVDDAIALSSGTTALHLGVRRLGWGEGDEVLTTPLSFIASSNSLLYEGATPKFCDVDPVTLNLDPAAAAAGLGDATAGVLPVHIFGYPANLGELEKLGLPMLEDACQALGAVDAQGRKVGASGNLASFAFYANKQMTTGEGGVLIPRDEAEAEAFRSERNQGRDPDMSKMSHDRIGFNYRMTDLQAAIGIAQVERLNALLDARAKVAQVYRERLGEMDAKAPGLGHDDGLLAPCANQGDERRSWFVFCVQLPTGADRDAVIALLGERGIQAKAYLPCIHTLPPYRDRFGFKGGEFPVAESASARSVALPFFGGMTIDQVDRVCSALGAALAGR